jgi:hypothetical protein
LLDSGGRTERVALSDDVVRFIGRACRLRLGRCGHALSAAIERPVRLAGEVA